MWAVFNKFTIRVFLLPVIRFESGFWSWEMAVWVLLGELGERIISGGCLLITLRDISSFEGTRFQT